MLKVSRFTIFLYLLPMLITLALVSIWPILYTLYLSFTNYTLFNSDHYSLIGLGNYQQLLLTPNSDLFFVLGLTVLYVAVCVALFLVIGMATALALNNPRIKGQAFWRTVLLVPWAAPSGITALIWKFLFNDDFGPINQIGRIFFGHQFAIPWLSAPWGTFAAVVITNVWLSYPFFTVVILGALQSIPQELNEAASVDGANAWKRFITVTLPLLRPAIAPAAILSAITTFQMFNTVFLINKGGPFVSADKPGFTEFVIIYMYNRILGANVANPHYALIAAFSILLFIILALATFLARTLSIPASKESVA
ncbi:sugar ABC transporter permease [Ktedonosporobacter rubrisoli]|uniref:Sugar ABC transporter permease n=1 Tax=Ktedonosporobacter rubrisoli TaxID=2509675 RepID=A0A4P6K3L7_KTERU|nr:sugar ABC transporter permease [Ktedonosporobacter rubrisoli]QBD82086.1 sugar ABC transporter permease [Ktedonosporobacter rubrisoli]